MFKNSRFKFTDPIFYDGLAWNYLKYDPFKKSIEAHIIVNYKENYDKYIAFMNIVDSKVIPDVIGDQLYLSLEDGKCIVKITIVEKKECFFTKKFIRANYKFSPTDIEETREIKLKNRVDVMGYEKWDIIANYLNRVFE